MVDGCEGINGVFEYVSGCLNRPDEAVAVAPHPSNGAVAFGQATDLLHKYLAALYVFCSMQAANVKEMREKA
jgi:hypothetical protein